MEKEIHDLKIGDLLWYKEEYENLVEEVTKLEHALASAIATNKFLISGMEELGKKSVRSTSKEPDK